MRSSSLLTIPAALIVVATTLSPPIEANSSDTSDENLFCEQDFANVTLCTKVTNIEIVDPCKDDHEQCDFWASIGECRVNPNYMLDNCPKSCEECEAFLDSADDNVDTRNDHGSTHDIAMLNKLGDLNVIQEKSFGENKIEKKNTFDHSQRMDEYKKALFQHPSTTSKTRKLCINELAKCAYYASLGLCEQRVIFMLETCPLACMMCDKKEQFDKCVGMRHPFDLPLFISDKEYEIFNQESESDDEEGVKTVDSFFQAKRDDSRWVVDHSAEYVNDPIRYKNGDSSWIVKLDNVVSAEECQSTIDIGNEVGWTDFSSEITDESHFVPGNDDNDKPKYSFKSAKCGGTNADMKCDDYSTISNIQKRISDLTQIPLAYFEPSEIIQFPESNGYQSLQHNYDLHDIWKIVGPRVLSFYIPLTSVEKGGYMGFPSLDWLMIHPKAGQMILWSNVMSNDPTVMNEKMANEVLPVQKGNLYLLRIHVRQYDYNSAKSRGYAHCT